jgi:hypothetical protein
VSIELLRQADYVLSACGRPTPPPGARWIDLPHVLTFRAQPSICADLTEETRASLHVCPALGVPYNTSITVNITAPQEGIGIEAFSLTVTNNVIDIVLETDIAGALVTTGNDVVAAVIASAAASALIIMTVTANGTFGGPRASGTAISGLQAGSGAASSRIENKSRVQFLCRAVSIVNQAGNIPFRIWWPNGRNLEQTLSPNNFAGSGSACRTLQPEVVIEPSGKITIEVGLPTATNNNSIFFYFWGVLRFMLKATGDEIEPYSPDTSRAPRIPGTQVQNIMAPEWMLGNQCCPETPDGYWDEPFTMYSDPIANPVGTTTVGVAVECPRDCEWFVIRNIQYDAVSDETVTDGQPAIQIRMPSGYSLTNGDYLTSDWTGPLFPELLVEGGGRVILDVSDVDAAGTGDITTTVQFDGVKRRRIQ